ncbi:hypothetical protein B0I35DRAFT_453201 [Stachybotrys elegans]|uniref:Signal recognition particle subunit SRP72 n=1 Tax=Stachybotrys elegans TaxID=80388 RepID=A0A8K0WLM4_9HYPO|nr:hypothetical protein B0I35DRAFT_453201 [Stachybotrys elegans]
MPQDPAAALSSLLRGATIDDHNEVYEAATAALRANASDLSSQHTQVVALLNLDRFDDALRVLSQGGDRLEALCRFEKAYALYKTGSLDEAAALLRSGPDDDRGFKHVAAQVAYRSERFDEAASIYHDLLQTDAADEDNDISINLSAARAQLQWQGFSGPADDQPHDTFELCYNAACSCIARGSLDTASNLLQRAVRICDASDLSDEDKEAEMQPILAQQAYVYARLGKMKEAMDISKSLDVSSGSEADFSSIVKNNTAVIDPAPENPYLLQRKAASWLAAAKQAKLFNHQSSLFARNSYVIDIKAHKTQGVQQRTANALAQAQHPSTKADVNAMSVLNAAASAYGASGKGILSKLVSLSEKRPKDLGIVLTIMQVQQEQGQAGAALATLESFLKRLDGDEDPSTKDARFSPGLVALAVSLMRAQGREASAKAELVKAATYWTQRPVGSASSLLREAGIELLRSSNSDDLALAGSAFEKLLNEQHGSHVASAGLVASLAPSDPSKIQQYLGDLPPVDSLIGSIDVASLISAGVATLPKTEASKKRAAADDAPERATKKRRHRKLPKNYVEGKVPDPERWLPLRDRSSYRPKGKKGKKKAADSTQGGVVKEEETLELVGGGGVKVERASGASASSKKKKKGKK